MLKTKSSMILAIGVAATLATPALAQEIPAIQDVTTTGKFTIASSLSYAPFEFIDEQGKPTGVDIELATEVAKLMKAELDIVTMPFASQIPSLAAGRIKVAWASFSVTEERLKQVDFVTFLQAGSVISTKPELKDKFTSRTSLCGAKVAIQTGSAADLAADKLNSECSAQGLPAVQKSLFPEQKDAIQAVLSGRVEAQLDDSTSSGYYEAVSGGKLVITSESFYPTPLGVAVAKGDTATASMLEAALERIMANGTYAAVLQKYHLTASGISKPVKYTAASQLSQ